MNVVVTGSSIGIGRTISEMFLKVGHIVHGIDVLGPFIEDPKYILHCNNIEHGNCM